MALTTDAWDATELAAYIGEVWPGQVDEEFFAKPVAANFFRDLTAEARGGGDIFHIPDAYTNAFSVQTQSTQGAEVTTDAPAAVDNTLTINNHVYIATLLGDKDAAQIMSSYNIERVYNSKAVGTLIEDLEADLFALHSSITTNTTGDTASVVSDIDLRAALEKLESADISTLTGDVAWFFHPYTYFNQVLAIQKYYDAQQAGWMTSGPIVTGNFGTNANFQSSRKGTLYGVPVYTSSKVVNTLLAVKNLLAHRDALTFATQTPGSRIRVRSQSWLANLGVLTVWDMINGVAAMREKAAVVVNGSNAFLAS